MKKVALYSNSTHPLHTQALEIVSQYFDCEFNPPEINSGVDLVISIFNSAVLPRNIISYPNFNIHAAPQWHRGFGGIVSTLHFKLSKHAVVAHQMLEKVDSGKIYKIHEFSVYENDDFESLLYRTERYSLKLLNEICEQTSLHKRLPDFSEAKWEGQLWTKAILKQWLDENNFKEKEKALYLYFTTY